MDELASQDRVARAVSLSFIGDLPPRTRRSILAGAIRMDVPAGSVIYRDADQPRVGLVLDGLIRVYLTSEDARQPGAWACRVRRATRTSTRRMARGGNG